MNPTGHDMRLLTAACVTWAVLASALALRLAPTQYLLLVLGATLVVTAGAVLALTQRAPGAFVRSTTLAAAVCGIVLGAAYVQIQHEQAGPIASLARVNASALVEALVTGQPHRVAASGFGGTTYVVPVTIVRVQGRGRTSDVETPAVVLGNERWQGAGWHTHVEVRGKLLPSQRLGAAQAMIRASGAPQVVGDAPAIVTVLEPVRSGLRDASRSLPRDAAGLLPALVVGDTAGLPDDLVAAMNTTGMSHLNAVSGSNVTIVLVATMWVLAWTGLGARGRFALALLALAAYVVLCRPEPSVVRAAAMGAVGLMGTTWGRPRMACPALGAAIVMLLLWDPWLAISAGFALSALATLGLVLFARTWAAAIIARWGRRWPRRCDAAVEVFCIPLAAQALCLPILVALSGSVSWVSIPANIVAEPFVAPATLGGMVVALVAPFWAWGASWLAWLPGLPAWAICGVAHVAAAVPGGSLPWIPGIGGVVVAAVLLVVLLCAWRAVRWAGRFGVVSAAVILAVVGASALPLPGEGRASGAWVYAQCDVGQGDAALIRTGPGHAVAVDVGPREGHIGRCLERHGVRALDAIILTHFHADHVGGLPEALDAVGATPVYTTWVTQDAGGSEPESTSAPARSGAQAPGARTSRHHGEEGAKPLVDASLRAHHLPLMTLAPGQEMSVGDTVFHVLWPRRVLHDGSVQNNASLVLDVTSPRVHALMLGDCEREAQAAVTADVQRLATRRPYDLVKVAHHGSANQNERLYRAAAAPLAVIGVGAHNDYGHPAVKTLGLLAATGSQAQRTDTEGDLDVVLTSGGLSIEPQR